MIALTLKDFISPKYFQQYQSGIEVPRSGFRNLITYGNYIMDRQAQTKVQPVTSTFIPDRSILTPTINNTGINPNAISTTVPIAPIVQPVKSTFIPDRSVLTPTINNTGINPNAILTKAPVQINPVPTKTNRCSTNGQNKIMPDTKMYEEPISFNTKIKETVSTKVLPALKKVIYMGRTEIKRREVSGKLGSTENASLLDLIVPTAEKGKPLLIMEHSIAMESIAYLGLAAIAAGIVINKFS